jgi:hypothetical protein
MNLLDALTALEKDKQVIINNIKGIRQINSVDHLYMYICEYKDDSRGINTMFIVWINPKTKTVAQYNWNPSYQFTELDEITTGKTIEQLKKEIAFQLKQGEPLGGTIVSHLVDTLENLKKSSK